jgi:myo-inositol-1(or 4)-monophosphatase
LKNLLSSYLDFAVETAWLAGRLTLGYFQSQIRPDFKPDQTPVTVADKKAEELIRSRIEKKFPDHAIVGEEYGASDRQTSELCWYIDPIDGTKAFTRGVPLYSVLIGFEIDKNVEVGVVFFPALNEMVAAATGLGCRLNGRLVKVSDIGKIDEAVVTFTDAASFAAHGRGPAWQRILDSAYVSAGWGDAYGHCLVATGRAEAMFDPVMEVWDCAPFPPILREAGGYFGDWSGNQTIHAKEAISVNAALLPSVLELINRH